MKAKIVPVEDYINTIEEYQSDIQPWISDAIKGSEEQFKEAFTIFCNTGTVEFGQLDDDTKDRFGQKVYAVCWEEISKMLISDAITDKKWHLLIHSLDTEIKKFSPETPCPWHRIDETLHYKFITKVIPSFGDKIKIDGILNIEALIDHIISFHDIDLEELLGFNSRSLGEVIYSGCWAYIGERLLASSKPITFDNWKKFTAALDIQIKKKFRYSALEWYLIDEKLRSDVLARVVKNCYDSSLLDINSFINNIINFCSIEVKRITYWSPEAFGSDIYKVCLKYIRDKKMQDEGWRLFSEQLGERLAKIIPDLKVEIASYSPASADVDKGDELITVDPDHTKLDPKEPDKLIKKPTYAALKTDELSPNMPKNEADTPVVSSKPSSIPLRNEKLEGARSRSGQTLHERRATYQDFIYQRYKGLLAWLLDGVEIIMQAIKNLIYKMFGRVNKHQDKSVKPPEKFNPSSFEATISLEKNSKDNTKV